MYRIYSALIEIVAAAVFIIPIWCIYNKLCFHSWKRTIIYMVFGFYFTAVLALVGFPNIASLKIDFAVNIIPFLDMVSDFINACLNILLFVPFGFFLPILWDKFRNIKNIALMGFIVTSLIEISQFWAGTHSFLWLIGEAIFHFLPVGITWAITKKMGTTQILGIVLGITLVSPQLLNAYAVSGGTVAPVWDFGFAQVNMIGYQAQVIPAILAGFVLVYLERFFRKISPASISMITVPFFALAPAVLIAHTVLGPIGWTIGSWISTIVYSGLTSSFSWLFAGVFGFIYAPLVITGLHHMTNAIDLQLMAQVGGTLLWPMIALSNIAQGSAVLAMIYLQRKNEEEKQVSIPACISAYLGVTEPALFGVNLKYGFPFICGMIGSGIAAVISVASGVMANAIGIGGIPGILSIQPQHMLMFAVAMVVAIVVPFVLTVVVGKKKLG